MKLRLLPDDFQVDERTAVRPARGRFAFYRLRKRSIATLDAVQAVARRLKIPRARISFGGLKDAQAVTSQHLTIEDGPRRGFREERFELQYLGQVERPFHASDIRANQFGLTLRDLPRKWNAALASGLEMLRRDGFANYFDSQRFWSRGESGEFVAEAWLRRDYERACRIALCDPLDGDRPADRRERAAISELWGEWEKLAKQVRDPTRRAMIEHLVRAPRDFRRALTRIPHDQRSLYLAAFQSSLWNQLLSAWLEQHVSKDRLRTFEGEWGSGVLYRDLSDDERAGLCDLQLPLPSARLAPATPEIDATLTDVLARQNLTRREIKLDYPRDTFFSKGERTAIVLPADLEGEMADDERHAGQLLCRLNFELPRGAYATMLVSQLSGLI